jgi:hypothetical protein
MAALTDGAQIFEARAVVPLSSHLPLHTEAGFMTPLAVYAAPVSHIRAFAFS